MMNSSPEGEFSQMMLRYFQQHNIKSKVVRRCKVDEFTGLGTSYPILVELKTGHWAVVIGPISHPGRKLLAVLDPRTENSGVSILPYEEFDALWTGTMLFTKRIYKLSDTDQPFGWRWFMPEIVQNRKYFRDVAISQIMSTLIAFTTPLFFNLVIDKVIPHHSYQTLYAVLLAFVIVSLFDGIFNYMRQVLMIFATNKIDARLASRSFDILLSLPMTYFENTPTGVLMRNIMQTESVRGFLTGRLFFTILDCITLPILLFGLAMYSVKLTAVVLLFSLAIASIIGFMLPIFKRVLDRLYSAEGSRQADLVETIHGMRAVKSLALEGLRKKSWDSKVAASVRARAQVGNLGALSSVLTGTIGNSMQIVVLSVGALLIFDGSLSMGAMIAFNMLAGRVTQPLLQVVGLINEYQQTALGMKMLGTIIDHPPERDPNAQGIKPEITGQLEFDQVTFSYEGSSRPALNAVSFKVEEGQIVGVVGRSGSGKTTLTRLIQGIHTAQQGLIKLNGVDIRHVDLVHLRRSIGVVLQDNILFRGTIRDNIAAANPNASLPEIMEAARMAGAEEFIDRLPLSYDTPVGEGASNFSGGQRQRIAIARALLTKPQLLIFDEATSALDPESEAIVQENLNQIAAGRTIIIVSHRLSSLVNSDYIMVLEQGNVVDFAPHSVLLTRCDVYRHLWQQQTQHIS